MVRRVRDTSAAGCVVAILLASMTAAAAESPPPTSPPATSVSANPHDIDGVWWTPGYDRKFRTVDGQLPPFTERGRREWEHNVKADEAGTPVADAPTACLPHGIPRLL